MSAGDMWATPIDIYRALDREFNFCADMAASDDNHKHEIYWTEQDDSLAIDWHDAVSEFGNKGANWLYNNPPYSNISPWVDKAIEAQRKGTGVVMLVMADPSVAWFAKAAKYATEIRFVTEGRISFLENGKPKSGNNKGSVFFIFAPRLIGTGKTTYVTRKSLLDAGASREMPKQTENYSLAA